MAIDTAEKRRSASKLLKFKPGVTPNVSKDQEWRQQSGRIYSGILVGVGGGAGDSLAAKGVQIPREILKISGG